MTYLNCEVYKANPTIREQHAREARQMRHEARHARCAALLRAIFRRAPILKLQTA
jgi:hypothetical protein